MPFIDNIRRNRYLTVRSASKVSQLSSGQSLIFSKCNSVALSKNDLLNVFLSELPSLTRFFRRATGSTAAAEDLSQETWIRLVSADSLSISNPSAYLRRISSNLVTDIARSRSRRRLSAGEVHDILNVADPSPDPEARLIAKDAVAALLAALDDMPERRRAILLAARLENVPHRILAETYGVSTRTIEIEIRKAVEHCARALLGL